MYVPPMLSDTIPDPVCPSLRTEEGHGALSILWASVTGRRGGGEEGEGYSVSVVFALLLSVYSFPTTVPATTGCVSVLGWGNERRGRYKSLNDHCPACAG